MARRDHARHSRGAGGAPRRGRSPAIANSAGTSTMLNIRSSFSSREMLRFRSYCTGAQLLAGIDDVLARGIDRGALLRA